jgi:hypothetical protein
LRGPWMSYRRVSHFANLQDQLLKVSARGARATKRMKVALVVAYGVRADQHPSIRKNLVACLKEMGIVGRSASSLSRRLVRAALPELYESNYTRLAQLLDRAIASGMRSKEVYACVVEEGLDTLFRRKSERRVHARRKLRRR